MKIVRRVSGFTLMELCIVIPLLTTLVVLVSSLTFWMAGSSAQTAAGSAQAVAAANFSELFRNDVRQAQKVSVFKSGDGVELTVEGAAIVYKIGADSRIERSADSRIERTLGTKTEFGPVLDSLRVEWIAPDATCSGLLKARWECAIGSHDGGRVLILDTALRAIQPEGTR